MGNSYDGEFSRLAVFRGDAAALLSLIKNHLAALYGAGISSPTFLLLGEKNHAC